MPAIRSADDLRSRYRHPSERAVRKQLDRLDPHCRRFVELSPFVLLASSGRSRQADVSPRGGEPGFVAILDDRTLAIPDSPGNNRLDSLSNVVENPEVALLFLVPGVDEVLRVNGTAEVLDDETLCTALTTRGRPPATVIRVAVRDAYLHCAKAVMRARLWHEDSKVERSTLPSLGQMLKDQIGSTAPAETQEEMAARYEATLY